MNRALALIGALLLSSLSIASACVAESSERIRFTLGGQGGHEGIQANFRTDDGAKHDNNWDSRLRPAELVGLDLAGFRGAGARPLRFSVIREAGRLDCSGVGGAGSASGICGFTPDLRFVQLLERRGIDRPTKEQAFGLMAVNVHRELIDAIADAHYPTPSVGDLMGMSALGVDGSYIRGLAAASYRPRTSGGLIQFKALDINPQWIAGFVRAGYGDLGPDELVQLRALGITPAYIAGFDRLGYRRLPVAKLVQLKALDITPAFIRAVAPTPTGHPMPSTDKLIALKVLGERR